MVESILQEFCDKMDERMVAQRADPLAYHLEAVRLTTKFGYEYFNSMLLKDWEFRSDFGMNIIASITGQQGRAFKSIFGLTSTYYLSDLFGVPFDLQKDILVDPWSLDYHLKHSPRRSTRLVDEVEKNHVGLLSNTVDFKLSAFEKEGRETQKNVIYCTPRYPAPGHYFYFVEFGNDRVDNSVCDNCPLKKECLLHLNKTICESPEVLKKLNMTKTVQFWERVGYPKSVQMELKTPRRFDGMTVSRFIVNFPAPTPKTLSEYSKIKTQIINRLESDKSNAFNLLIKDAEEVFQLNKNELIWKLKKGDLRPIPDQKIQLKIFAQFGMNKYPIAVYKLMVQLVEERTKKAINDGEYDL